MRTPLLLSLALVPLSASAGARQTPSRASDGPSLTALGDPAAPRRVELAGVPLAEHPRFLFTRTFNEGEPVFVGFDPLTEAGLGGRTFDVYLLKHGALQGAVDGQKLKVVGGPPLTVTLTEGGIAENTFLLDPGTLPGGGRFHDDGVALLGRGYDVVVDIDGDGLLGPRDRVDGGLAEDDAGFWVVQDFVTLRDGTKETGAYAVTEIDYQGSRTFTRENIYFPTEIASLGEVPLVVVSHGNGHNYQWYDHVGYLLASWGYVVMSHQNNTGPGIEAASETTLRNTEVFLTELPLIAGGQLVGHVDGSRIVWMGHSRGGEGVVRAYRRMLDNDRVGQFTAFTAADIKLVSSIAPTDFLGAGVSDMGSAPYHLWTGGADDDVNGCANCEICQTFHLLERADGTRYAATVHGAGHGDFHDGGGSSVAAGPCRVGRATTHTIMRAYLLPLVQHVVHGNPAAFDYVARQWREFRALGTPDPSLQAERCAKVELMYLPGPELGPVVLDDFQAEPSVLRSSSGGGVSSSRWLRATLREGRYDDPNANFTPHATDVMNGMTLGGVGDATAGAVLAWNGTDEWLSFEVPPGMRDLRDLVHLSFRAAQTTRDPLTVSEIGDAKFAVELTDSSLRSSVLHLDAYGRGLEEPYNRSNCGLGQGWHNGFETVRLPLADFRRDGNPLDLGDVIAVTFRFGPSYGSPIGRIGLDEIVFTRD